MNDAHPSPEVLFYQGQTNGRTTAKAEEPSSGHSLSTVRKKSNTAEATFISTENHSPPL